MQYLLRKKNPETALSKASVAESHTMTTTHHAVWTKAEIMGFFSDVWGLCDDTGGLRGGSTRHQKSTKLDIHGRKCGNHTAKAQHMMQRRRGRKLWSTVHAFRGFVAVLRATTLSKEDQRELHVTDAARGVVIGCPPVLIQICTS